MIYRKSRRPFRTLSNLTGSGTMMETGRNAPCPCGSGKKYKHCCLKTLQPDPDREWRRLGEVYHLLEDRLRRFAERVMDGAGMEASFDEFLLWPEEAQDAIFLERQGPLFCSWAIFNWTYDPGDVDPPLRLPPGITPAAFFLERERERLSDTEISLIETISRRPFSFYEVIRCEPGRGFLLKDVLTGEAVDVLESSASKVVYEGEILFARVATINGITMLFGCSSYTIPLEYKPSIIALRKWMRRGRRKLTEAMLCEYDAEIREEYLEISRSLFRLPSICNTDGEPLSLQTLHYEIDSPDQAFTGLVGLCATETEGDLRALAQRDAGGRITRIEIPWTRKGHKNSAMHGTILGILLIEGKTLEVSVNSAARAERIRKEIENRLGSSARYKNAVIRSGETVVREARDRLSRRPAPAEKGEELMQYPEVRAKLAEMMAAHWRGWVDERIPALGGKTPRQAVKTADGRESVEALLLSAERRAGRDSRLGEETLRAIEDVRQTLSLPRK